VFTLPCQRIRRWRPLRPARLSRPCGRFVSLQGGYVRANNPPQAFMVSLQQRTPNMQDPAFVLPVEEML
jgi:hypothetical protein